MDFAASSRHVRSIIFELRLCRSRKEHTTCIRHQHSHAHSLKIEILSSLIFNLVVNYNLNIVELDAYRYAIFRAIPDTPNVMWRRIEFQLMEFFLIRLYLCWAKFLRTINFTSATSMPATHPLHMYVNKFVRGYRSVLPYGDSNACHGWSELLPRHSVIK